MTGKAKTFSDIDLLIDVGVPLSSQEVAVLSEAFDESGLPYKVDIADARSIEDAFLRNIQSQLIELV